MQVVLPIVLLLVGEVERVAVILAVGK